MKNHNRKKKKLVVGELAENESDSHWMLHFACQVKTLFFVKLFTMFCQQTKDLGHREKREMESKLSLHKTMIRNQIL